MASINSYADIVQDWVSLLAALKESAELETTLSTERLALEQALADVQSLKVRQESQAAGRQELTQQIKAAISRGKALAITIRAVAKGKIGYRNERLVHFRVAPIRHRSRKPVVKPPVDGPTDEPGIETKKPGS
jgi:hypothetical protein